MLTGNSELVFEKTIWRTRGRRGCLDRAVSEVTISISEVIFLLLLLCFTGRIAFKLDIIVDSLLRAETFSWGY